MSSFKFNKLGFMVAGAALLALAVTQGCSSDDDSQAAPSGGAAGSAGKGNAGKGGDSGAGDTSSEAGSGNTGNTGNTSAGGDSGSGNTEAGAGGEAGGSVGPNCTGANGCYSCAPTTSIQFENGCVAGGCPDTFTDKLSKIAVVGTL